MSEQESKFKFTLAKVKVYLRSLIRKAFFIAVISPTLAFAVYEAFFADERYESQAIVVVKSTEGAQMGGASLAILAGVSPSVASGDPALVASYIHSADMLSYLDQTIDLRTHFSGSLISWISRITMLDDNQDYLEYYRARVIVEADPSTGLVYVNTQAFDSAFAKLLLDTILTRTEWYINDVSQEMARQQLQFIENESERSAERLAELKAELMAFQREYSLLNASAEGESQQQITYTIESEISSKEAQLRTLRSYMSDDAPQVLALQIELAGLREQAIVERLRATEGDVNSVSVSEVLARYNDLKMRLEFATQAYSSSILSLEVARVDAYKQLKFLSVVQSPTQPESAAYPRVIYNVVLLLTVLTVLFLIAVISRNIFYELQRNK